MSKKPIIILYLLLAFLFATAADVPETELGYPFTAVVNNLEIRRSPELESEVTGILPAGVKMNFRAHPVSRAWVYIDDEKSNIHGWVLADGGYFGDTMEQDYEWYASTLDYTIIQLGYNPHVYDKSVDSGYDDAINSAYYSSSSGGFLKWVILIGLALVIYLIIFADNKNRLLHYGMTGLAAVSVMEAIYSFLPNIYRSFSDNNLFNLFIVFLLQAGIILLSLKKRDYFQKIDRIFLTTAIVLTLVCATVAISQTGIVKILSAVVGGVFNIIIGVVVLIVIYAFFKDGIDSKSSKSSGNASSGKISCRDCIFFDASANRCKSDNSYRDVNDGCSKGTVGSNNY